MKTTIRHAGRKLAAGVALAAGTAGLFTLLAVPASAAPVTPAAAARSADAGLAIQVDDRGHRYGDRGDRWRGDRDRRHGDRNRHGDRYNRDRYDRGNDHRWHQSRWYERNHWSRNRYAYGPRYYHPRYGKVRPFISFVAILSRNYGYHSFGHATFYGHGANWTPHYLVPARDRYGRRVTVRICAYTGNVLGWRY